MGPEPKNGAGLGLHICKKILKQHNATIDFKSELGVGTTFFVTLPAQISLT
jgi:signal transduction histidine kinase